MAESQLISYVDELKRIKPAPTPGRKHHLRRCTRRQLRISHSSASTPAPTHLNSYDHSSFR